MKSFIALYREVPIGTVLYLNWDPINFLAIIPPKRCVILRSATYEEYRDYWRENANTSSDSSIRYYKIEIK